MRILSVLLCIWLIQGCAADISKETTEISVTVASINAWYNLMPGSPGSFNMAGEIVINNDSAAAQDIRIDLVTVYQQDKEIYRFTPVTEVVPPSVENDASAPQSKRFLFSTRPGLSLKEDVIDSMPVSANIHLIYGNSEVNCKVDSIKIEKAY